MRGWEVHRIGRRKTSVARTYMRAGEGKIMINGLPYEAYFGRKTLQMVVMQPLVLLGKTADYDIMINVVGGGKSGQAGACRHAISRSLDRLNPDRHGDLKRAGFLTRDAREVERKKYGKHKARKRPQYSKR